MHPTEIVKNGLTESNPNDYLFLKVQENIPSQRISQLDPNPLKGASDKIYVIGHPCGIPMKIGLNGSIRDNTNPNFFVSTLDTYGGNSGSPVFKAANNKVIGILIKGHKDFVTVEGCRKSFRCGVTECRGEDATRIAPLISIIPK